MQIFGGGEELLQRSDVPQLNLIPGTSQEFKTITIAKGNYYPEKYVYEVPYDYPCTFSAVIENDSKYDIVAHMDGNGNDADSNVIAAKSTGKAVVRLENNQGVYYRTKNRVNVDSDIAFKVKEEKLEKGYTATPWCPAREDYAMKSDKVLTAKNLIQALFSDELVNIVDDNFDMNNARPGIYRSWGKKPINTPNQCLAWAKYFVIPFVEGYSDAMFQVAIDTNGNMFTRTKGGSPAVWNPWHLVNLG